MAIGASIVGKHLMSERVCVEEGGGGGAGGGCCDSTHDPRPSRPADDGTLVTSGPVSPHLPSPAAPAHTRGDMRGGRGCLGPGCGREGAGGRGTDKDRLKDRVTVNWTFVGVDPKRFSED